MEKQVFIINGKGGVGKDTVCSCAAQFYRVRNISSITPIVEIARFAGWNGEKTLAARRMLSQLKAVFTEFNDLSFTYCMQQYRAFEQQLNYGGDWYSNMGRSYTRPYAGGSSFCLSLCLMNVLCNCCCNPVGFRF